MAAGGSVDTVKEEFWDSDAYPKSAPIMRDLLNAAANWLDPSFDLWEDDESDQFYTRMVWRKSLVVGAKFATSLGLFWYLGYSWKRS